MRWVPASYDSTGIWVISLKDNSRRFLHKRNLIVPIGWSPDGQWIYALEHEYSENKANIVMINDARGQAKKLVTLPFPPHALNLDTSWGGMTPDEKQFICPVFDKRSDVWLLENFDPEVK